MGLLEKIFPKTSVNAVTNQYFKTFTAYRPAFRSFNGGIYEAELCRASIHAFATHCAKLKPEIKGDKYNLKYILSVRPNPWQTTYQWLYRTATILETDTTAFIVPVNPTGKKIEGFYTVKPTETEVVEALGKVWLKFRFANGEESRIEWEKVGVLTKFQYDDDLFGGGNRPLYETLEVINTQNQGIIEAIKNAASIRFMAILANNLKAENLKEERKKFAEMNLQNNDTGVMMFDQKYTDVKQITSNPVFVDDKQSALIRQNVYNYFGVNEKILTNDYTEDVWNAFYEGKIEPFAIQLSQVLTGMIYSSREVAMGDEVVCSSNRLQYASNQTKLNVVTQLFDRGMMTTNMGLEIFNLPGVGEAGDKYYIRKEYAEIDKLHEEDGVIDTIEPEVIDEGGGTNAN